MRLTFWTWTSLSVTTLTAACGGGAPHDPHLAPGFDPPPPAADEIRYLSPIMKVRPAEDVLMCSYLPLEIDKDSDLVDFKGYSTAGSHHAILYGVGIPQKVDTHLCLNEEMINLRLLAGIGGDEAVGNMGAALPPGLTRRIPAHTQLMIQTHWINAQREMIEGQVSFNVKLTPMNADLAPTDLLAVMSTDFTLPPKQATHTETRCLFEEDVQVWELAGHQHKWGQHIRIVHETMEGAKNVLFEADWRPEWSFNVKWNMYQPQPLVIHRGESIFVACDWDNSTDAEMRFPSEMCGAIAQFYPSTRQLLCFDGKWL